MEINKVTNKFIDCKNVSVIENGKNLRDITVSFLTLIVDTEEYKQLETSLFSIVPDGAIENINHIYWKETGAETFIKDLIYVINLYTPNGYHFGEHSEEKFNYGFWKKERFCPVNKAEKKKYYGKRDVFCYACIHCDRTEYKRINNNINFEKVCKYDGGKNKCL